ncbi:hypothetical protein J3F83DRAFT_723156 [Trichoderma novae-zelandiae]
MSSSAIMASSERRLAEVGPFHAQAHKRLAHSLRGKSLLVPIALRRPDDLSFSLKINSADCQVLPATLRSRYHIYGVQYDVDAQMRGITLRAAPPVLGTWSVRGSEPFAPFCITGPSPLDEGFYRCPLHTEGR